MQELQLHLWAVLVAALAKFFLGWLWFSPMLFMNSWMSSAGVSPERSKEGMVKGMATYLVGTLLMSFVLAHAIKYAQMAHGLPDGLAGGLIGGFINWLGLVAPVQIDGVVAEKKPFNWFLITGGYQLVGMLLMGGILGLWA
jgi:hypothetical protein